MGQACCEPRDVAVCQVGAWNQCGDTQDTTLLKPFLLLMLGPLCGFGSAIWQKRVLDVTWGCVKGSPWEGTCVCSGVLCAVVGEFPSQAMLSFPCLGNAEAHYTHKQARDVSASLLC